MKNSDSKAAKQKWKNLSDYYGKVKKPKPSGSDAKEMMFKQRKVNLPLYFQD